jgi:hypothetical protein
MAKIRAATPSFSSLEQQVLNVPQTKWKANVHQYHQPVRASSPSDHRRCANDPQLPEIAISHL